MRPSEQMPWQIKKIFFCYHKNVDNDLVLTSCEKPLTICISFYDITNCVLFNFGLFKEYKKGQFELLNLKKLSTILLF